jgi:hypothetical protein
MNQRMDELKYALVKLTVQGCNRKCRAGANSAGLAKVLHWWWRRLSTVRDARSHAVIAAWLAQKHHGCTTIFISEVIRALVPKTLH